MKSVHKLIESMGFLAVLTFVGGYINAYTFVTRGQVFANNQTGNMARLGIELYNGNLTGAMNVLTPILATVLGAFCAQHVMTRKYSGHHYWYQQLLLRMELAALFVVGFIPATVPHSLVNATLSFVMAWQLSGFRSYEGWMHNTTIVTGNLRSMGQHLYAAIFIEKEREPKLKALKYILLVFSFAIGAFAGVAFSTWIGIRAVWVCCGLVLGLIIAHARTVRAELAG